jgi:hypothetical protein
MESEAKMAKRKSGGNQGAGAQDGDQGRQHGGYDAGGGSNTGGGMGGDRIPASLKEFGQKAAELAQNPIARSVIAAGLVTAAAALTTNQKVRDSAKKTAKGAADATEEAAAGATRLGEALVTAATDTFRRMFNLEESSSSSSGSSPSTSGSSGSSGGGAQEEPLSTPRKTRSSGAGKTKASAKSEAKAAGVKASGAKSAGKSASAKGGKTASSGAAKTGSRRKGSGEGASGS